jgi:hypothetical protein
MCIIATLSRYLVRVVAAKYQAQHLTKNHRMAEMVKLTSSLLLPLHHHPQNMHWP